MTDPRRDATYDGHYTTCLPGAAIIILSLCLTLLHLYVLHQNQVLGFISQFVRNLMTYIE